MNYIVIISLSLGIIFLLLSCIEIKFKKRKNLYRVKDSVKLKKKIFENKYYIQFTDFIVGINSKSSQKTLSKLKMIKQYKLCEATYSLSKDKQDELIKKVHNNKGQLKKLFLIKLSIFTSVLVLGAFLNYSFSDIVKKEMLHPNTISKESKYKVSKDLATSITNFIGDSYIGYIKDNDLQGLVVKIYEYTQENNISIDEQAVEILVTTYYSTYSATTLSWKHKVLLVLIALLSTFLVDLIVNIKYSIAKVHLLKEFEKLENIALLQMKRTELNLLDILREMRKYSVYLSPYLDRCLNMYTSDCDRALKTLEKSIDDNNFKNFIQILRSCLDNGKAINAEILTMQRKLRMSLENTRSDEILEKKVFYLTLAIGPLIFTACFCCLIPILLSFNI